MMKEVKGPVAQPSMIRTQPSDSLKKEGLAASHQMYGRQLSVAEGEEGAVPRDRASVLRFLDSARRADVAAAAADQGHPEVTARDIHRSVDAFVEFLEKLNAQSHIDRNGRR